jgi:DNA-binding NtrC family response regulator
MKKILVIDDDRATCDLLGEILGSEGWRVETAQSPDTARRLAAASAFDLVISDINLEADETGLDLLAGFRESSPVILITAFGSLDTAVAATREGAWDFISKPFKVDEIVQTVRRALEFENGRPGDEELSARAETAGMVGRSPAMIDLYKEIARVAPARSTVLILGESGTGKELIARAIHQYSPRAARNFVPVNCGALTESLLESELFGHVKGSFTGAQADRRGLWEEADGGTLFLDEIGEIGLAMQVKLLRALQEGEIRRVGSSRPLRVDTRVIAATNRDLESDVKAGKFREDLFYRLSVVTLRVPPLRERRGDIPLLAGRFLEKASANAGRPGRLALSGAALGILTAYEWKGNVRELEAAIEHAALRSRGREVTPDDLPEKLRAAATGGTPAPSSGANELYADLPSLDELEKRYLRFVLERVGGNRTRAAEVLGVDRRTLYRMAERFGLKLD